MATEQDKAIASYLQQVSEYKAMAENASSFWREGFINLARAQLDRPFGQHNYDLQAKPAIIVKDGCLQSIDGADSLAMFGGCFAPQSLKAARADFVRALQLTLDRHAAMLKAAEAEAVVKSIN